MEFKSILSKLATIDMVTENEQLVDGYNERRSGESTNKTRTIPKHRVHEDFDDEVDVKAANDIINSPNTDVEERESHELLFKKYVTRKPREWVDTKTVNFYDLSDEQQVALQSLPVIQGEERPTQAINDIKHKSYEGSESTEFIVMVEDETYYISTEGYPYARYAFHVEDMPVELEESKNCKNCGKDICECEQLEESENVHCTRCNGTGTRPCKSCGGSGYKSTDREFEKACPQCRAKGDIKCSACQGSGYKLKMNEETECCEQCGKDVCECEPMISESDSATEDEKNFMQGFESFLDQYTEENDVTGPDKEELKKQIIDAYKKWETQMKAQNHPEAEPKVESWEDKYNKVVSETESITECQTGLEVAVPEVQTGMNVSTNVDTKTGNKSVTVTATGEAADELACMLMNAGLGNLKSGNVYNTPVNELPVYEEAKAYANEPDPLVSTTEDQLINRSGGMNAPKKQVNPAKGQGNGDNGLTIADSLATKLKEDFEKFSKR